MAESGVGSCNRCCNRCHPISEAPLARLNLRELTTKLEEGAPFPRKEPGLVSKIPRRLRGVAPSGISGGTSSRPCRGTRGPADHLFEAPASYGATRHV